MNNLSAFLNPIKIENIKYVASKRFVDEDGKAVEWEIGCIPGKEDDALRKSCSVSRQVPGKRGQYFTETDYSAYLLKLAARCTVFPDLNSAELQNAYNVRSAEDLLATMLTPGEKASYLQKVQAINDYDKDFDEAVEEAKN